MLLSVPVRCEKITKVVIMLRDTSKFKFLDYVYNIGNTGFVVARGYWNGDTKLSLACRWEEGDIGYPQTFGHPQWMVLPENLTLDIVDALSPAPTLVMTLKPPVAVGRMDANATELA